jgi:hypothetical protein
MQPDTNIQYNTNVSNGIKTYSLKPTLPHVTLFAEWQIPRHAAAAELHR